MLGSCLSYTTFTVGDMCQFQLTIQIPPLTPTTLYVELESSDNSTMLVAQICQPTITFGSNYNLTIADLKSINTYSSLATSQLNIIYFDFGSVQNSGLSPLINNNSIIISFSIVILDNGQYDGEIMYTSANVWFDGNANVLIQNAAMEFASSLPNV